MRFLYTLLFYLALPYSFGRLLWRSRKNKAYRQHWGERLGFVSPLDSCIWVHAASVGETMAALPLIKNLKKQYPHIPILITNMTITGRSRVKAAFSNEVHVAYIPYDVPLAIQQFLKNVKPMIAIFLETELWPNIFKACQQKNIPLVVTNARLSEKSARGYQRIGKVTRDMLQAVNKMAVQTDLEAQRFYKLGLRNDKITVTGNIKFDIEIPNNLVEQTQQLQKMLGERLIWVAASTHPGEEEIVLAAHQQVLQKHPNSLLILVPRHPERFNTVHTLCLQKEFKVARRSIGESCDKNSQVYLADTMGELLLMYSVCDVAFIGGSLVSVGGHNMLEAAVVGKPVLSGNILFNFAEISKALIAAQGMQLISNAQDLADTLVQFFNDKPRRETMGGYAKAFVEKNRGALQKQLSLIKELVDQSKGVTAVDSSK